MITIQSPTQDPMQGKKNDNRETPFLSLNYRPRYSRLKGDLTVYSHDLEKRIGEIQKRDKLDEEGLPEWAKMARKLISATEVFLEQNKIDEGWKSLHAAMRMEIYGMNDRERKSRADVLRIQAQSFDEFSKKAVLELLGEEKENNGHAPDTDALIEAIEQKDRYYNDLYYQNRLLRNLYSLLFLILSASVAAILIYFVVLHHIYGLHFEKLITIRGMIIGVSFFGLLGATTSAILFTRSTSTSSRKSEFNSTNVVTSSKLFVGVSFTIFIFILLNSSVAESIQLFNFKVSTPIDYFAIAFVSGFSERLAQRAITAIAGKDQPEK